MRIASVGGIIFHPEHGYLLQFRDEQAPTQPHTWSLFGGGMENSENPLDALYRELEEEIELKKEDIQHVELASETQWKGEQQYNYFVRIHCAPEKLVLHEGEKMGWFWPEQFPDLTWGFNAKEIVTSFISSHRQIVSSLNERTAQDS